MTGEAGFWFPFHIKDIRSETYSMGRVEKSVYIDMLALAWELGGDIPADDKWLTSELNLKPREWADMRDKILRWFISANGRLSHPRISVELGKARQNIEQKKRAGMASAQARKASNNGNGCSTGVGRALDDCSTDAQPYAGGGGGVGDGLLPSQGKKLLRGGDGFLLSQGEIQ